MESPQTGPARPVGRPYDRVPSLTGLRWWAALAVFACHALSSPMLFQQDVFGGTVREVFTPAGPVGVSFFFVLSGFVLTWSVRSDDSPARFWRRRAVKILPNHWTILALAIAFMAATNFTAPVHHVTEAVLLLQPWTLDFMASIGVSGVTWSLGCEAFFYLCFPLWIHLIGKIRADRLWWWAGGVTAAILVMPLVARLTPDRPEMPILPGVPEKEILFTYFFPPVRTLDFLLGILIARIVLTDRWTGLRLRYAVPALAAGYAVAVLAVPSPYHLVAATIIPIALLIPAAAASDGLGTRHALTNSRVMIWLGETSFAFFLLHPFVLQNITRPFGPGRAWDVAAGLGLVVLSFAVSLALARLVYLGVERPLYRRFAEPRSARAPRPPQPVQPVPEHP